MGKCCGQGGVGSVGNGGPQAAGGGGKRCVTGSHNEEVCHGTNERRRDLLDQLKIFLDDFDERPCQATPPQDGPDGTKPLGQYPEYMKKHCQSWMPQDPRPPLITSVQAHEIRTTSDFEKMKNENSEYVSYKDGRSKPPPSTCDCTKRNGLQDQCPRPECTPPTPQCLATNPGPCCPPSLGMTGREANISSRPAAAPQSTYQQDFRTNQSPQGGNFQSVYRQDYGATNPSPCCSPSTGREANTASGPAAALQSTYQQDFRINQSPHGGNFQSVYREDYGAMKTAPQQAAGGPRFECAPQAASGPRFDGAPQAAGGPRFNGAPMAQQMICFCRVPPSTMPPGKKYLCCPLPE